MTGIEIGLAIWFACVLMAAAYVLAATSGGHEHQPSPHPNGRCPICGLDATQETR